MTTDTGVTLKLRADGLVSLEDYESGEDYAMQHLLATVKSRPGLDGERLFVNGVIAGGGGESVTIEDRQQTTQWMEVEGTTARS